MSPETHFLASWVVGTKFCDNPRDCGLVALAGILPDLDGLGLIVDWLNSAFGGPDTHYYAKYHHYFAHGAFAAILITLFLTCFARRKWRVATLALLMVHFHLLCDFVGSRGPSPEDLWPIFYFGPFDKDPMWIWEGQWPLDGWQNRIFSYSLLTAALWMATSRGYSFLNMFSNRFDRTFVEVLQKWRRELSGWQKGKSGPEPT